MGYLSHHVDGLRGRLVDEDADVRIADEASVFKSFLDQFLRFIHRQIGDVHVVDQRKVHISAISDTYLGVEIGNSVNAELNQIAGAELGSGTSDGTRRLWGRRVLRGLQRRSISRDRRLGQEM